MAGNEDNNSHGKRFKLEDFPSQIPVASARNALLDSSDSDSTQDFSVECVIDNVVNRVLESYRTILGELESLQTNLESVAENVAIQSAIDVHGLHLPDSDPDEAEEPATVAHAESMDESQSEEERAEEMDFLAEFAISSAISNKGLGVNPTFNSTERSSPDR